MTDTTTTASTEAPVIVYTTDTCPWCDRAKEFLRRHNVPFVEKNVARDYSAAIEMIRRSGQQAVPVIATENEVIVGFDQVRLARIAERYAGPKRPPLGLLAANAEDYFARHPEAAAAFPPGTKGVYVGEVRPDSVAEKSGIRPGDVITVVAGKRVRNMSALDSIIDAVKAGESITVRYLRGSEERTTTFQF
ncbi:MAG TPA: glutaredoxin domain-containing protein [Thermomicrobiales bacterium]